MFRPRTNSSPKKLLKKGTRGLTAFEQEFGLAPQLHIIEASPRFLGDYRHEPTTLPPRLRKAESDEPPILALRDYASTTDSFTVRKGDFYHRLSVENPDELDEEWYVYDLKTGSMGWVPMGIFGRPYRESSSTSARTRPGPREADVFQATDPRLQLPPGRPVAMKCTKGTEIDQKWLFDINVMYQPDPAGYPASEKWPTTMPEPILLQLTRTLSNLAQLDRALQHAFSNNSISDSLVPPLPKDFAAGFGRDTGPLHAREAVATVNNYLRGLLDLGIPSKARLKPTEHIPRDRIVRDFLTPRTEAEYVDGVPDIRPGPPNVEAGIPQQAMQKKRFPSPRLAMEAAQKAKQASANVLPPESSPGPSPLRQEIGRSAVPGHVHAESRREHAHQSSSTAQPTEPTPARVSSAPTHKLQDTVRTVASEPNLRPRKKRGHVYTRQEVEKHNTRGDVWLSCNGRVYDVSRCTENHPLGDKWLLDCAGEDVSAAINRRSDPNAQGAWEVLKNYEIGLLAQEVPQDQKPRVHEPAALPASHPARVKSTSVKIETLPGASKTYPRPPREDPPPLPSSRPQTPPSKVLYPSSLSPDSLRLRRKPAMRQLSPMRLQSRANATGPR